MLIQYIEVDIEKQLLRSGTDATVRCWCWSSSSPFPETAWQNSAWQNSYHHDSSSSFLQFLQNKCKFLYNLFLFVREKFIGSHFNSTSATILVGWVQYLRDILELCSRLTDGDKFAELLSRLLKCCPTRRTLESPICITRFSTLTLSASSPT